MNACIFANGELDFKPALANNSGDCLSCDCIIAADGGARHCLNLGIRPDLIIGDMDSIDPDTESTYSGIVKIPFRREKDKTDSEYAIIEALKFNYSHMTIFGGIGGRIDHTIGNLWLAAVFLLASSRIRQKIVLIIVSYAAGTLLGAAFIGMLPKALKLSTVYPIRYSSSVDIWKNCPQRCRKPTLWLMLLHQPVAFYCKELEKNGV